MTRKDRLMHAMNYHFPTLTRWYTNTWNDEEHIILTSKSNILAVSVSYYKYYTLICNVVYKNSSARIPIYICYSKKLSGIVNAMKIVVPYLSLIGNTSLTDLVELERSIKLLMKGIGD